MSSVGGQCLFVAFVRSEGRRRGYKLDLLREINKKQLGRVDWRWLLRMRERRSNLYTIAYRWPSPTTSRTNIGLFSTGSRDSCSDRLPRCAAGLSQTSPVRTERSHESRSPSSCTYEVE